MSDTERTPFPPPEGYDRGVLHVDNLGPVVLICQRCGALVSEWSGVHDAWHASLASAEQRTDSS